MKQKDTLVQLEELSKRIGLMVKQYNDLARSESLGSRLIYGIVPEYSGDDLAEPRVIFDYEEKADEENSWSNSGCEWQSSSENC